MNTESNTENVKPSSFGLWEECPASADVAWGARAIALDNSFDLLHDRQTWFGPLEERRRLSGALNQGALSGAQQKYLELRNARSPSLRNDEQHVFTLYDDGVVTIKGDTRGSCGYLYLIGFFNPAK